MGCPVIYGWECEIQKSPRCLSPSSLQPLLHKTCTINHVAYHYWNPTSTYDTTCYWKCRWVSQRIHECLRGSQWDKYWYSYSEVFCWQLRLATCVLDLRGCPVSYRTATTHFHLTINIIQTPLVLSSRISFANIKPLKFTSGVDLWRYRISVLVVMNKRGFQTDIKSISRDTHRESGYIMDNDICHCVQIHLQAQPTRYQGILQPKILQWNILLKSKKISTCKQSFDIY